MNTDSHAATPAKMLPFARALAGDVQAALSAGMGRPVTPASLLAAAGLTEDDRRRCELNSALEIALDNSSALNGWLAGTDTLAPSRAAVEYGGG